MKRLLLVALLGCSKPSPPAEQDAAPSPSASTPTSTSTPTESATAAPTTSGPELPDSGGACPADMVLVDGDYCTDLELTCKKSWYAKWNDKTICEEFESPSKCVGQKEHRRFCIDQFEFPNKKGERPRVMFKFGEAQHLCAALGKCVCTETEWTMACEGPEYKPYPYGYVRDPTICRGDQQKAEPKVVDHDKKGVPIYAFDSKDASVSGPELERLWEGVVSGSQREDGKGCVSDYGVWDMPGNADELASSETPPPASKFDNVTTGGPWRYGVRNQCRPKIYTHDEGFYYYYLSTRCCAEADGKPTDPRAPKQIKRGEKWKP